MGQVRWLRGRLLWIPVAVVVAVGGLLAGTVFASAAAPNLPKKTAAQLLAAMEHPTVPPALTAVISQSANLGFPALPDIAGMPSSALSAASWLAGSHTVQIWYSGPRHIRIAVPVPFGETDLRVNGSQAWLWQSHGQIATHIILAQPTGLGGPLWRFSHLRPAQIAHIPGSLQQRVHMKWQVRQSPPARMKLILRKLQTARGVAVRISAACPVPGWSVRGGAAVPWRIIKSWGISKHSVRVRNVHGGPLLNPRLAIGVLKEITPLKAAQRLLAMIGPSTKVSVTGTTVVAGRAAYQLSISPRSNQSLIGQILVAVDGQSYLPLQVQVIPRGSSSPAFSVGFTSFTPGQPAASNFTFTPPPGAHVHTVRLPSPMAGLPGMVGLGGIPGALFGQVGHVGVPSPVPPRAIMKVIRARVHAFRLGAKPLPAADCLPRLPGSPLQVPAPAVLSARPRVIGSGWLSVVEIPAGQALAGLSGNNKPSKPAPGASTSPVPVTGSQAMLRTLLNSATRVHGSWGSGRLISTRLLNILITDKGQVLIGAVTPAVLYADAAQVK